MRAASAFALFAAATVAATTPAASFPDEAKAHGWRMLDTRSRARAYASWNTIPTTEREFRAMQRRYRPEQFAIWAERMRQLRPGMTEKQVLQILPPRREPLQLSMGGGLAYTIELDDAYYVEVFFDERTHRMLSATTPLATTYEIKPATRKPPKT